MLAHHLYTLELIHELKTPKHWSCVIPSLNLRTLAVIRPVNVPRVQ